MAQAIFVFPAIYHHGRVAQSDRVRWRELECESCLSSATLDLIYEAEFFFVP